MPLTDVWQGFKIAQMSDLADLARRGVNTRTSSFRLTLKRPKISKSNLAEVEIFRRLGLIKEVLVCKKVLIEFLTKFILDNV